MPCLWITKALEIIEGIYYTHSTKERKKCWSFITAFTNTAFICSNCPLRLLFFPRKMLTFVSICVTPSTYVVVVCCGKPSIPAEAARSSGRPAWRRCLLSFVFPIFSLLKQSLTAFFHSFRLSSSSPVDNSIPPKIY